MNLFESVSLFNHLRVSVCFLSVDRIKKNYVRHLFIIQTLVFHKISIKTSYLCCCWFFTSIVRLSSFSSTHFTFPLNTSLLVWQKRFNWKFYLIAIKEYDESFFTTGYFLTRSRCVIFLPLKRCQKFIKLSKYFLIWTLTISKKKHVRNKYHHAFMTPFNVI